MKASRIVLVAAVLLMGTGAMVAGACSTSSSVGNGVAPSSGFVGLPASCSGNVYYELHAVSVPDGGVPVCGGGPVYVLCGGTTYGDEFYCDPSQIPSNYTSAGRQPFDGGPDAPQTKKDSGSPHDSGTDATAHDGGGTKDAAKHDAVAEDSGKHDAGRDAGEHDSGKDAEKHDTGVDAGTHDARAAETGTHDAGHDAERG